MAFIVGDVVVVARSGRPKMTVEAVSRPASAMVDTIYCVWFAGDDKSGWTLCRGNMSASVLAYPVENDAVNSVISKGRDLLAKGDALASKWLNKSDKKTD